MTVDNKVWSRADLLARVATLPRPLVMTNGVFDVLHRGHVSYLDRAAALGSTLLVAVNSDSSARSLGKGPDRPLNTDTDRAYVLAGLASVSMVALFDEGTPVELLKLVRPDVYVKGGDYDMESLEETRVVRSWGGGSVALPFVEGFSTTSLVNRIQRPLVKAAFLDRDGVINVDKAYVHRWDDFEFLPGSVDAMLRLQSLGYALVVVTNQSGIARGLYSEEQYQTLTDNLRRELEARGVQLAAVYHCPHLPGGSVPGLSIQCDCRKPAPGMLYRAARDLGISMPDSVLVGDKISDIAAAQAAGVGKAYLVESGMDISGSESIKSTGRYASLLDCVNSLC